MAQPEASEVINQILHDTIAKIVANVSDMTITMINEHPVVTGTTFFIILISAFSRPLGRKLDAFLR
jgi:hypothetical protein